MALLIRHTGSHRTSTFLRLVMQERTQEKHRLYRHYTRIEIIYILENKIVRCIGKSIRIFSPEYYIKQNQHKKKHKTVRDRYTSINIIYI